MCRINGIFSDRVISDLEVRINRMNDSVKHGGPDAGNHKILFEGKKAFGHRRLSIIDLDARSNQPFTTTDGRWIIVFNGEIYNFKELKENIHYSFKTESDTEVLIAGIAEYGIDLFIQKCNGMFGFAAYDSVEDVLYICRDRLGIKPLYYYYNKGNLIFSSEIKGILNSGLVEARLDERAIDDYFAYRYVREPNTMFQDIKQVKSGYYMIFKNGRLEENQYWDIPADFNMETEYNETEILQEFSDNLIGSVKRRMIADVPVGSYLSGGVDSSLLSAIAAKNTLKTLNTYTIGFPELNEFEYARTVADKYNTNHHEILICRDDYLNKISEITSYKDAPLGVPNEIPLALMSRELKKTITVVLSGEGADELLGGYGRIFRAPFDFKNVDNGAAENFYSYFMNRYEYVPRIIRDRYLAGEENYRAEFDSKNNDFFKNNVDEYNVFWFFHKYHVKGLLQRVDTTTMLAAVEARVPFLDHTLVEFSYKNIPYDLKLHWQTAETKENAKSRSSTSYSEDLDTPKYLLKRLSEQWIPKENIYRKKVGFPVPLSEWHDVIASMCHEYLDDAPWLKNHDVDGLIKDCKTLRIGDQIMWMFVCMGVFYRMYFEKEWRY